SKFEIAMSPAAAWADGSVSRKTLSLVERVRHNSPFSVASSERTFELWSLWRRAWRTCRNLVPESFPCGKGVTTYSSASGPAPDCFAPSLAMTFLGSNLSHRSSLSPSVNFAKELMISGLVRAYSDQRMGLLEAFV